MEIKNVYQVQGAFLTEEGAETLKKLQLHDNRELKNQMELLDNATSFMAKEFVNLSEEKKKEVAELMGSLNTLKKKIKNLSKP